jgi:hypothetical protein
MLCDSCQTFLNAIWSDPRTKRAIPRKEHYKPYQRPLGTCNFQCTAASSCYICSRILARFKEKPESSVTIENELPIPLAVAQWSLQFEKKTISAVHIEFAESREPENSYQQMNQPYFRIDLVLDKLFITIGSTGTPQLLSTSTHITNTGELISQWLTTCIESHPNCGALRQPDWYPTRLLDLGESDGTNFPSTIRLIQIQDSPPIGPYITLSYCRGSTPILNLNSHSLSTFKNGISIEELPKTFAHAVEVARYLQIRYLWIAALTILHDTPPDLTHESLATYPIFSNALFTIAATSAPDPHGGLFFSRDPELLVPHKFARDGLEYAVQWEKQGFGSVQEQPLMKRAWAVTERWLSPRIAHFCRDQVYFECKTDVGSEQVPVGLEDKQVLRFNGHPTELSTADDIRGFWVRAVIFYTRATLGCGKDKLVAFAGMAKIIQRVSKDRYCAGLWERDFLYNLTWSVSPTQGRIAEYVAPSWSWAAVNGVVYWYLNRPLTGEDQAKVRELSTVGRVQLEYVCEDTFGQVKAGYVEIQGPMVEVELDEDKGQLGWRGERVEGSNRKDDIPHEDRSIKKFYWLGLLVLDTSYPDVTYHMGYGALVTASVRCGIDILARGLQCRSG